MIRIIDFCSSLLLLILLIPLFLILFIVLSFTGEGEIFYFQERLGKNGKLFNLIKFATMLKNSPNILSKTITVNKDPRILPFGRFLRLSKINELPQLINILRGDMSFVGPRPLTLETFNYYPEIIKKKLKYIKPGLSGLGSIFFFNEESIISIEDNPRKIYKSIIAPYKGELELWFKNKLSVKNYFLVILCTIYVVIFKNNRIIFKVFKDIPKPNISVKKILDY